MSLPFLVTHRISDKTLGAVYATSILSAHAIAGKLWSNDKDALSVFDLRKAFEVTCAAHQKF